MQREWGDAPCAEVERRQPALGPVERTELCMQVGCTAAEAMMESKEVWIRGQKEEVRVFHMITLGESYQL